MKKVSRMIKAAAFVMLIAGAVITGIGYSKGGKLNFIIDYNEKQIIYTSAQTEKETTIDKDGVSSLRIENNAGDIRIKKGTEFKVTAEGDENDLPDITTKDGKLVICSKAANTDANNFGVGILSFMKGRLSVGIPFKSMRIEVEIPEGTLLENIEIISEAGNVKVNGIDAKRLEAELDVGNIDLSSCSIADIEMKNDCGNIDIESTVSDILDLSNDMGNIDVKLIGNIDEYVIDAETDLGEVKINGDDKRNSYSQRPDTADKHLKAENDCGNIHVRINK